jgi:hypothetical protein
MDCSVLSFGYDHILQAKYPAWLRIKSTDRNFHFQADLELEKISDRKDLLEGVNPLLKSLIKRMIAKPVYHGILANAKLKVNDYNLQGYGNIESMIFREK